MSSRSCAKPGCNVSATATLAYDYAESRALLESLEADSHPMHYDLCTHHADHLRVPQGWELDDRRLRYPAAVSHALAS